MKNRVERQGDCPFKFGVSRRVEEEQKFNFRLPDHSRRGDVLLALASLAGATWSGRQRATFGEDLHVFWRPRERRDLLRSVLLTGGIVQASGPAKWRRESGHSGGGHVAAAFAEYKARGSALGANFKDYL
jgi:hypothetical protein